MLLSGLALLACDPSPAIEAIKEALTGNPCRCTSYTKIYEAVQAANEPIAPGSVPQAR
jgi:aerobic-type carbon monoxide dehydrogenase small subunit (CoxS/CutS family)